MAVDFGDSRTGLAVCDKSEFLASPLTVVHEYNFDKCAEKTAEYAKNEKAELIVVGYPRRTDGTAGERAEKCEKFAEKLTVLTGIPHKMWDERFTTVSAHNYLNETNVRGQKRKNVVDAVAAVIILESYLGYRKNNPDKI
jgi:putative Holliday junction resolvase